jgi:hypothetical protein
VEEGIRTGESLEQLSDAVREVVDLCRRARIGPPTADASRTTPN